MSDPQLVKDVGKLEGRMDSFENGLKRVENSVTEVHERLDTFQNTIITKIDGMHVCRNEKRLGAVESKVDAVNEARVFASGGMKMLVVIGGFLVGLATVLSIVAMFR